VKRPPPLDAKSILDLQRTAGNQHVVRLLRPRTRRALPEPVVEPVLEPVVVPEPEPPPVLLVPAPRRSVARWQYAVALVAGFGGYEGALLAFPALPFAGAIAAGIAGCAVAAGASQAVRRKRKP
jgi:hypothetical protein